MLRGVASNSSGGGGGGGTGDVVGPASATDNAIARYDSTTGKLIQNSGIIIDDSNNVTGVGTLSNGTQTITSSSAAAFTAGQNGSTNPALTVDSSVASSVTGLSIASAASGGSVTLQATSSSANAAILIQSKASANVTCNIPGTGSFVVQTGGTNRHTLGFGAISFVPTTDSTASTVRFRFTGAADTSLTASTEAPSVYFNSGQTRQHATGALTLQRDFRITASTHSAVGASTITNAAALSVDGAPIAGTNATITNGSTLYSAGVAVGAGTTNSYVINVTANTGATNNYIASLNGSAGEVLRIRTDGQIVCLATNTAGGTTGAQTINKPSGTVNFAAAATSLVVTNSLCTTSSIVLCTLRTNDTTARIANVVPGAGSFTINLTVAATAETSCGFLVIN